MKTHLMNYWLYLYLGCIYFLPLLSIIKSKDTDTRFMLRKLLFPLEYLIQVKVERFTHYSRSATRLIHILVWPMSVLGLVGVSIPLTVFNEPLESHTALLLFITYYCMLAPITFWFQPRADISTQTK